MHSTESTSLISELKTQLPEIWHDAIETLANKTLQSDQPLRLILVGAFTVGKSSLLNMLFGEPLLQTALEETTALPTFIEYGQTRTLQLLGSDGSLSPLTEADFARVTTQAPAGAACAIATLPHDWLQGVSVIDLPGLGGLSATHREYTLAQIQQADAILYLIAPRGPDASDIATLNQIRQYGKRIKLVAARWDEAEEAVARGEKRPSLEHWAIQIETASGIKARLAPVSKSGLGREEVIDFIRRARDDIGAIRLRRFRAELRPLVENALGQNAEAQRVCEIQSEESGRALHAELMQRKQALTALKSSLYEREQQDRVRLDAASTADIQQQRTVLDTALRTLAGAVQAESEWDDFGNQGADRLRATLVDAADTLSGLSENYGRLQLPEAQVAAFNLRLPPAESVDAQDFLDLARFSQLQAELEARQSDCAAQVAALAQLPEVNLDEHQSVLRQLMQERQQIAAEPLPRIIQRVSDGGGATLGRMIGEICDIGLFFVNPAAVGLKVASLLGKGAKVAGIAVKTAKIAKTVTKTVKVAQAVQAGKTVVGVPPQAMDKLAALEVLSLGYWGERIGAALGGAPRDEEIVDPEAQAQQQQILAEMDARTRAVRAELARCEDIANEHQLTGWALEQNRKEQEALKADLAALNQRAEARHREFERAQIEERQRMLRQHVERALSHWLKTFDQQTDSMSALLRARVSGYWETHVDELVSERLADTESLVTQISAAPAEKEAALAVLRKESAGLRSTLETLA